MPMPEHDVVRLVLDELEAVRADPASPRHAARLEAALGHESNRVVARAAELACELRATWLAPLMTAAFARLTTGAARRDPQCHAKLALVDALHGLGCGAGDVFRAGARHVQLEPAGPGGGTVDTAGELRGSSIRALIAGNHDGAWELAARALTDADAATRLGAIEAIELSGDAARGVPLLRSKARGGDVHREVMSACLGALLCLDAGSMAFVASFLDDESEPVCEAAAIALGESQQPGALPPLRAYAARRPGARRLGLMAIALLRTRDAVQYLLDLVAGAPAEVARDAADALLMYRREIGLADRLAAAVAERTRQHLQRVCAIPANRE